MFDESGVKHLVERAVEGYTATVFAYGQTGTGKSYTITGPEDLDFGVSDPGQEYERWGLVPRALRYMFDHITRQSEVEDVRHTITASYLEIYNEQVQDLLNPTNVSLPLRYNNEKGHFVENLFVVECEVLDDTIAVLEEGLRNRRVGSHRLNEHSSRSHGLLNITIETVTVDSDDQRVIRKQGKITFVDLAGSEKVKESRATGGTLTETLNINKSLLCLGNCISALAEMKRKKVQLHVPYRDSKLTKLLSDTLGGNGIAVMIACVSPSSFNFNETLNTLRYASRARKIQNKPIIQMDPREELIMNLKAEVKTVRAENESLRRAFEELSGTASKSATMNRKMAAEMKVSESPKSKETITMYMEDNRKLQVQNEELSEAKQKLGRDNVELLEENDRLVGKIEYLVQIFGQSLDEEIEKAAASLEKSAVEPTVVPVKSGGGGRGRLSLMARKKSSTNVKAMSEGATPTGDDNDSRYDKKRVLANTLSLTRKKHIDRSLGDLTFSTDNVAADRQVTVVDGGAGDGDAEQHAGHTKTNSDLKLDL